MKILWYFLIVNLFWNFSFSQNATEKPKISFSFDDPTLKDLASYKNEVWDKMILKTLKKHKMQSTLYVCGMRIDSPEGLKLLKKWDKKGHKIANHSYYHYNFNSKERQVLWKALKVIFLKQIQL